MTPHDNLRKLAMGATKGPWTDKYGRFYGDNVYVIEASESRVATAGINEANAAFIAAANPQTVLGLLDEIERLREAWLGSDVRDLKQQLEAARADAQMYRERYAVPHAAITECAQLTKKLAVVTAVRNDLRAQLAAMTAARNEACELLDALLAGRCGSGPIAMKQQVSNLRKVGQ